MKKIITGILTTTAVLSLAACGCSNSKKEATKSSSSSSSVVKKSSESSSSKVASSEQSETNNSQTEVNPDVNDQEVISNEAHPDTEENNQPTIQESNNTQTENTESSVPKTNNNKTEQNENSTQITPTTILGSWKSDDGKIYTTYENEVSIRFGYGQAGNSSLSKTEYTINGNTITYKDYGGGDALYPLTTTVTYIDNNNIEVTYSLDGHTVHLTRQ